MKLATYSCGMKPFYTLFAALLVLSALRAQTPWTSWNIYRDSTGNGASPVSGGLVCPSETLWLVVDTTGMADAGITGYRWIEASPSAAMVVHCTGSPDCPPTLPASFPVFGISSARKVGIKPNIPDISGGFALITYYSNGDSAISVRAYHTKGVRSLSLQLPSQACAGSTVNGYLEFSGNVDSVVITYGTTTIRNQTEFTITLPSGSNGSLTVTAELYFCGSVVSGSRNINYYTNPPAGPQPFVGSTSGSSCPNAPLTFEAYIPSGYTTFVWKVDGNSVDPSSTNHPLTYTWTPPGPGTYVISYEANYPCGRMTGATSYTVSSPSPRWSGIYISPLNSGYCPGMNVSISGNAVPSIGLYTLDIGNDGSIEQIGSHLGYYGPVGNPPLPIRIRFDNLCGGTLDTLILYNPSLASQGSVVGSAYILPLPPAKCGEVVHAQLVVLNFPTDSIQQVQWSWDGINWTPPSNRLDTFLRVPSTPGPWTLYCQFTANSSPGSCFAAPASPVSETVSPDYSIPPLRQISSFCSANGGVVRLVLDGPVSGIDSVRYMLPNGTSITLPPGDTLVLTVPSGTSAYPIVYYGYTPCGLTSLWGHSATASFQKPAIIANVQPSSVCPGTSMDVQVSWASFENVDSIAAILWDGRRVSIPILFPFSSARIPAPAVPGYYDITIIAYNCAGADTVVRTLQVTGGRDAVASFTAPASACVNQPVTFQRNGTNAGILYALWSFGYGNSRSDTSMTVSHTYTDAGTYIVRLLVRSVQCGTSIFERVIRVYDASPALSGLNVIPSGLTITYSVSASDYDQIVWDFGDGNTASGVLSGTHTYASAGTYTVKVRAINACNTTELIRTVSVTTGLLYGGSGAWVVYPNLTRQEVFLAHPTYQGDLRVEIYDLTGRLVQTEMLSSYPVRVRLSLPNGIYTLRLISREGVDTFKLLVE